MAVSVGDLIATLRADARDFTANLSKAEQDFKRFTETVAGQSGDASQKVAAAWRDLGARPTAEVDAARAKIIGAFEAIRASGTSTPADVARAQAAMAASLRTLAADADPAKQAVASLGTQMESLGLNTSAASSALGFLLNPLTLVGAAVIGLGLAVRSSVNALTEHALRVRDLAAVSGVSVAQTSALADTFTLLGLRSEALTVGLFRMGQRIDAGGLGISRLGISVKDAAGNLKPEGDLFLEIRDRISELGEASARSALLIEIFGRGGRELAPAFALSREEFRKWLEEAKKIRPWSDEAQASSIAYVQALNKLSLAWEALKERLGAFLVPVATNVVNAFDFLIERAIRYGQALSAIPDIGAKIGGAFRGYLFSSPYAGAALGEPGSVATQLPELEVSAKRPMSPTEVKAAQLEAQSRLDAIQRQLERAAALRGVFEAAGPLVQTPREAAEADLRALDVREKAERAFFARMKALAAEKDDFEGTAVKEMVAKEQAAYAAIEKSRLALDAKLVAIGKREADELSAARIKLEEEQEARDQKAAAFVLAEDLRLTSERVALYGTARERFVQAETDKARAAEQAVLKEVGDARTARGLIDEIYRLSAKKIRDYDFDVAKARQDEVATLLGQETNKVQEAFEKRKTSVVEYYATVRRAADADFAARRRALEEEDAILGRVIRDRQQAGQVGVGRLVAGAVSPEEDAAIRARGASEDPDAALRSFENAQSRWRIFPPRVSPFNQGRWPSPEEIEENQRQIREQYERMKRENPALYRRLQGSLPGDVQPAAYGGSFPFAAWAQPGGGVQTVSASAPGTAGIPVVPVPTPGPSFAAANAPVFGPAPAAASTSAAPATAALAIAPAPQRLSAEGQQALDQSREAARVRALEIEQSTVLARLEQSRLGEAARAEQKMNTERIKDLEDVNQAERRGAIAAIEIRQQEIRAAQRNSERRKGIEAEYNGFVTTGAAATTREVGQRFAALGEFMLLEVEKERLQAGDFWDHLATWSKETTAGIRKSLADNFFNFFKSGTLEAGQLFQSLLDAMLKAIANFLAAQVVQAFLNFALAGVKAFGSAVGVGGVFFGAEGGLVPGGRPGGKDTIPAMLTPGELVLSPDNTKSFLSALKVLAAPTGTLAPGVETLLGSSRLAGVLPGIANIGANFAAGGMTAVLFGQTAVQAAASAAGVSGAAVGGTTGTVFGSTGIGTAGAGQGTSGLLGSGGGVSAATGILTAAGAVVGAITAKEDWQKAVHATAAALALAGIAVPPLLVAAAVIEIGMLIAGLFGGGGPSQAWQTFGTRLAGTVGLEQSASRQLAGEIAGSGSRGELAASIARFKATLGTRIGGFGAGTGPFDIPGMPGAGGSKHEGGIVFDPSPLVGGLRTAVTDRLAFFDAQDRFGAVAGAFVPALLAPLPKFAAGGFVRGVGAGDVMPALLEPGEFVVPRAAAARNAGALESMRAGGALGGGGGGGVVAINFSLALLDPSQLGPAVRRRIAEELARDIDDALRRRRLRVYEPASVRRG